MSHDEKSSIGNVLSPLELEPAFQATRNRPRVVLAVSGGAVQWIVGDREDVDILVVDYDVQGCDIEELPHDKDGEPFHPITGPESVNPELVNDLFKRVKDVYG